MLAKTLFLRKTSNKPTQYKSAEFFFFAENLSRRLNSKKRALKEAQNRTKKTQTFFLIWNKDHSRSLKCVEGTI